MAEQALPLAATMPEVVLFGRLIATRDAPGVALGGLHLGASPVKVALIRGALPRPAPAALAVRRHRSSSSKSGFIDAYHLATQ